MRSFPPPALLLLLYGCASSSGGSAVNGTMSTGRVTIQTGNAGSPAYQDVAISNNAGVGSVSVAASPDRVWSVLPAVYASLGIPLSATDPVKKVLVAQNRQISKIGGKNLSSFFTCGGVYGDNADSGETFVSTRSQVLAAPNGEAVVKTEVRAAAGGQGVTVGECGSKGTLEKLIGETIQARSLAAQ
jgi:hypothetical protein